MGTEIKTTLTGDSKSLERALDRAGASAKDMAGDFEKSQGSVKSFGSSMDGVNNTVDASEGKFMGTADLLDGLAGAFGLPIDGAVGMARSLGDLAGGMTSVVLPAVQGILGKLGLMTAATGAQTAATTGAATAQGGLNAALLANPIGLVVIAIGALVAGFVLAWKHSETFRDIVRGAIDGVQKVAERFVNFFVSIPGYISNAGNLVVDAVTWPYKTAFNLIAKLWNNTVGRLEFDIPSWVPGLGGKGFSMPKLPTFHQGGVVPGQPGQAVPILAMAGETVTPAGRSGGGAPIRIQVMLDGRLIQEALIREEDRSGRVWVRAS